VFRTRLLLTGMVNAPLVMPEIITGITQLLLFVSMLHLFGWPHRGFTTIVIAHIAFCTAYVTITVQSRLQSADRSLEEAAMDLGSGPVRAFVDTTLPGIAPALASSWLLSFTLSLDDLVISSFVSGPGASTLPMVIFSKVKLGVSPDVNALAGRLPHAPQRAPATAGRADGRAMMNRPVPLVHAVSYPGRPSSASSGEGPRYT
jgi:putrescine transport system permease protein